MTGQDEAPYRRFTRWPHSLFLWRVSAWDHNAHAYLTLGGLTPEAICGHVSSATSLRLDDRAAPECFGCKHMVGVLAPSRRWPDEMEGL